MSYLFQQSNLTTTGLEKVYPEELKVVMEDFQVLFRKRENEFRIVTFSFDNKGRYRIRVAFKGEYRINAWQETWFYDMNEAIEYYNNSLVYMYHKCENLNS